MVNSIDTPFVKAILAEELDVIVMVKQLRWRYYYKSRACTLLELGKFVCFGGIGNIFSFLCITNNQKTYGNLFFMFCDDIQDMDLTNALQGLMFLFTDIAIMVSVDITTMLKK